MRRIGAASRAELAAQVKREGLIVAGWRELPTNPSPAAPRR